jgi:predicted nuclease of predicted toxin-antitoxin system
LGHDAVSVVELGLSGTGDSMVRATAIEDGRIPIALDGDFANVLRFPPAGTPGVLRLRVHPATERKIDIALRWAILRLAGMDLHGKLIVVDGRRIRIRS